MPLNLGIPRSYGLRVYRSTSQSPPCEDNPHGPMGYVEVEPELAHDHNGWRETSPRPPGWSEQLLAAQHYPQRYASPQRFASPQRTEGVKNSHASSPVSHSRTGSQPPSLQHTHFQDRHKHQRQISHNTRLQCTPPPQDPATRSQQLETPQRQPEYRRNIELELQQQQQQRQRSRYSSQQSAQFQSPPPHHPPPPPPQLLRTVSSSQRTPKRKSKGLLPHLWRHMHDGDSPASSPASPVTPITPRSNACDASEALANALANVGIEQWPSQPRSALYIPVGPNKGYTDSSRSEQSATMGPVKKLKSDQPLRLLPSAVERDSGSMPVLQPAPASAPAGITTHAKSASVDSASCATTIGTSAALAVACSINSPGVTVARSMTLSRSSQHRRFPSTGEHVKSVSPSSSRSSLYEEFKPLSTHPASPPSIANPGLSSPSLRDSSSMSTSSSWTAQHAIHDCPFDFSSGSADENTADDECLDWLDYGNGEIALLRDAHIQRLHPAKGRAQLVFYVAGREVHI